MKARGLVIMPHGVDSVNNSNRNQCFTAMMLKLSTSNIYFSLFVCLLPMGGQTRDFWEGKRVLMGVLDLWMVTGYFLFQSDVYFLSYMRKYAKGPILMG